MTDVQVLLVSLLWLQKWKLKFVRTGTVREGGAMSIGQQTGWNVIHSRRSSAFNIFVLDSKMAKQQLQKWELKFVTELDHWKGPPVYLFGEKTGLLWKNVWLPRWSETLKGRRPHFVFF